MVTFIFHQDNLFGFVCYNVQVTMKYYPFLHMLDSISLSHSYLTCSPMATFNIGDQVKQTEITTHFSTNERFQKAEVTFITQQGKLALRCCQKSQENLRKCPKSWNHVISASTTQLCVYMPSSFSGSYTPSMQLQGFVGLCFYYVRSIRMVGLCCWKYMWWCQGGDGISGFVKQLLDWGGPLCRHTRLLYCNLCVIQAWWWALMYILYTHILLW